MANNTWNFPCYTCNDWGSADSGDRGAHGMVWAIGPEVSTAQPFTNTITGIFSILLRTGWSDTTHTLNQNFSTIGGKGAASWGLNVALAPNVGGSQIAVLAHDAVNGLARHQVLLGDEDGVSLVQADKWYQVAFSMSATDFSYCVNGATSPTVTVLSAVDGDLNLDSGNDRWWYHAGRTANSGLNTQLNSEMLLIQDGWATFIVGAAAWSTQYVDWNDATARGRVFDANGDLKNPGEDGSLWFGDTYGANTPEFYFLDGSPRKDNGDYNSSFPQDWVAESGGGAGSATATGGLRKQYEQGFPDGWWLYNTLAEAEASGDAWVDGDTIVATTTGTLFLYKSDLAVSGYSGLIHKYPFGTGEGELSAVSVKGSEAADSDPDSWTSYAMSNVGTDGVDYDNDTNAGLSRLRNLTNSGLNQGNSTHTITASDLEGFRIIDQLEVLDVPSSDQSLEHYIGIYKDASNYQRARIAAFNATWSYERGGAGVLNNTTINSDEPHRIWLYIKDNYKAIWFDDAGSSYTLSETTTGTISGASAPMSKIGNGQIAASPYGQLIGTDIFGSMTTS